MSIESYKGIYEELNIMTSIRNGILSMCCGEREVQGTEVKEKWKKLLHENFIYQDQSIPLNQTYTTLYRWTIAKLTKNRSLICPRLPKKRKVQLCKNSKAFRTYLAYEIKKINALERQGSTSGLPLTLKMMEFGDQNWTMNCQLAWS